MQDPHLTLPNKSARPAAPWTPTGQKPSRSACLAAEDDAEYDKQLHEQEVSALNQPLTHGAHA